MDGHLMDPMVDAHEPGEREVVRAISLKRAVVLIANPARCRAAAAADRKLGRTPFVCGLNVFIVLDGKWPTQAAFRWVNCYAVSSAFSQLAPVQNGWV
ncbi:hypothetical protein ACM43_09375 [Bradyrhizobium sp. CCBAU 45321]|nr:hypothetical protein [Bradyrhizobium sp. CCBAU 45321]